MLGGDTPLGPPLVAGLEQEGYIVIASVSTPDAVAELEAISSGYVKALVLNPQEVKRPLTCLTELVLTPS